MDLATLDTQSTVACYAHIRELILDADLLPNSHHLEVALATRLNVDQTEIHSAALKLQHEGLVSLEPRGGFWIRPVDVVAVVDAFEQISMLEARAAFVAALHSPSSLGTATLDDSIMRMEDALFRRDLDKWARANHHFHRSLVQCSGHTGLVAAALPLSDMLRRARMLSLRLGPLPIEATQNHSFVVEAIRQGMAADARDSHLAHWRSAATQIASLLKTHRLDQMVA